MYWFSLPPVDHHEQRTNQVGMQGVPIPSDPKAVIERYFRRAGYSVDAVSQEERNFAGIC